MIQIIPEPYNTYIGLFITSIFSVIYFLIFYTKNKYSIIIKEKLLFYSNNFLWVISRGKIKISWKDIQKNSKLKFNNTFTTIVLPIILMTFAWFLFLYKNPSTNPGVEGKISIYTFHSVFIAPIWEEFLFRGILLGSIGYSLVKRINSTTLLGKAVKSIWLFIIIALVSIIFSFSHGGFKLEDPKILLGFIYGLLYFIDKKNVLPSMIAHSYNNLLYFYFV